MEKGTSQSSLSFCLKVKVLLQDLFEQLQHDVYSSAVNSSIQRLFSLKEEKKMRAFTARGRSGLEEHLKFIQVCTLAKGLEPSVNACALILTNVVGSSVVRALAMNAGDQGSNHGQFHLLR